MLNLDQIDNCKTIFFHYIRNCYPAFLYIDENQKTVVVKATKKGFQN